MCCTNAARGRVFFPPSRDAGTEQRITFPRSQTDTRPDQTSAISPWVEFPRIPPPWSKAAKGCHLTPDKQWSVLTNAFYI